MGECYQTFFPEKISGAAIFGTTIANGKFYKLRKDERQSGIPEIFTNFDLKFW